MQGIERLQRVIERYPSRQPQVKIVRHSVNRGVAAARNSGLDAATGEYIYYVDADDWLEKDAIGQMWRQGQANRCRHRGVWMVSHVQQE